MLVPRAWSAACCGGGFASPSIIAGDDRAQVTASFAHSEIAADVYASGMWRKRDQVESLETYRLDGAHIFADRWQVGASVPLVRRARTGQSSTGLGDIATSLGYEYLPDWDYSPWRPKGIGYLQLTVPTGESVYEAQDGNGLDSRGRGFWAISAGTLLAKIVGRWDAFVTLDGHRSFAKSVEQNGQSLELRPGWGANWGVGGGLNTRHFRFGGSLNWTYEDPIQVTGATESRGSVQRFATTSITLSYLLNEEWAGTLTYSDQTLIGNPVNTSLGQALALQVQRRWGR